MKLILHYAKRYKLLLCINIISLFGFALGELGLPTIIANMIDSGITTNNSNNIYKWWYIAIIISIISVIGTIIMGYCSSKISTSITRDIRNDIFTKIQTFSPTEYNKFEISSLITRTNNDAFQIQLFINTILRTALLTPIMIIISFILTIRTSLQLSLIIMVTLPIIILGVYIVAITSIPLSKKQQKSLDNLNRIIRENLVGLKIIRAFGNDDLEEKRFNNTNKEFTNYTKKIFKLMMLTQPTFYLLMNIASLSIIFFASNMIQSNTLQIGKLVAFQEYLFHAMFSMMLFCSVFMMYPRANVSAKRIQEIFDTNVIIINNPKHIKEDTTKSLIFNNVTFAYPDSEEAILKNISFKANSGETIAFIGSTGSGKSTLINLIPRFYDVSKGSILINGINIKDFDIYTLRNKIGFIPQKATLFSGTIRDNLCFSNVNATKEELEKASKIACCYDFIINKEKGFEQPVVEGGSNYSGGQKQRLSIARAIIKKPDIYIFDDCFSALDYKTDIAIRKALKQEIKDAIILIVAQRISTIKDANCIIVLNEGSIVGMGTHRELLENCQIYKEIALSQLSEEEIYNEIN